jgi:hypothetical protein
MLIAARPAGGENLPDPFVMTVGDADEDHDTSIVAGALGAETPPPGANMTHRLSNQTNDTPVVVLNHVSPTRLVVGSASCVNVKPYNSVDGFENVATIRRRVPSAGGVCDPCVSPRMAVNV